ncbi:MAG: SPOCS domain-containing protein [Acutalibacteraceae bacterium]
MDILLNHENYKLLKTATDTTIEENMEAEFSLPEFMPDILRIIKSTAQTKINSCRLVGERVTVDGECELKMIYTSEDGGIYVFSTVKPFTRHSENTVFADAADVTSSAEVSFVNCRATGNKRAEIKAGIIIKLTAFSEYNEDIISVSNNNCIEEKTESIRGMSLGCKKTKPFSMSDNISLTVPSSFIISNNGSAICSEIRKINNKIMIKGDAIIDICYVNALDKTSTERIHHIIPINQILEFEGMEERFTGGVNLCVTAVDVIQKNDSDGVGTSFDVSMCINAAVTMWEEKELLVLSDAYSISSNIDLKKQQLEFYSALDEIRDTYLLKDSFNVSGEGVSSILDVCADITEANVKKDTDKLLVSGSISLSLLIKDSKSSLGLINKVIDYQYERKVDYNIDDIQSTPFVSLISVDCNCKNNDTIDVRAELRIDATVLERKTVDAVIDITESTEEVKRNNNAITIYFPNKEESLWGIARRYNTTVEAIAKENDLAGDTTENLKILFIPAV